MLAIPGSSCAKHELQRSDSRNANATQTARFAGRGYNPTVLASPDFESRLTACGIRSTAQRTQIAALLLAAPQHLSAEQILARLRDAGARVSKATVYNTLKLFAAHGLIRELCVDGTRAWYDSNIDAHYHFHDVEAGALIDVAVPEVEFSRLPSPPPGMEFAGIDLVIRLRRKTTAR
jgi:Fur family transcriptional regulator, iron response regulator